ncbi:DUF1963 domain-containing protein [Streptomyces sp. NRRL S-813]|uniref:DUF1963 domain-containing protein n=1 Tax=Streptomyces sp. NRRL S-813 TaxID=1463919 RepID=UPI0004BE4677|nr:DUF1963 domain-containing protein [Streptomyces sp. NRRL S-813]
MTREMLDSFREEALASGIPAADVERWIGTARPCANLDCKGDGPVVGRLGGPVMLPADAPDPWCPLAASIDLAALPKNATDLPLPPDGQLLLFAYPHVDWTTPSPTPDMGEVRYVPAGTAVEERKTDLILKRDDFVARLKFPQDDLRRVRTGVSLPNHGSFIDPGPPREVKDYPYAGELIEAWMKVPGGHITHPGLQIGGYAEDEFGELDPAMEAGQMAAMQEDAGRRPKSAAETRPEDWVLLAQWWHGIQGLEMALFYWAIAREDLAARRFDRAFATMTWNP